MTGPSAPAEPMTSARIRRAEQLLRVVYLPVLLGHERSWRAGVDLAESLGDLLGCLADEIMVRGAKWAGRI